MAALVRANGRLRNEGGTIAIAGLGGIVADAIRIVRLDRVFSMYPSVDEAAKALAKDS